MDERLRVSLWVVVSGGLGAVLGGAFGGLAGLLYAQGGGAAGTRFGRRVADAFARAGQSEASPTARAALVGAADGFLFLGVVGVLAGAAAAVFGRADPRWLAPAALGAALLVGAAAFFGSLAYSMTRHGARAITCILGGGLFGSLAAGLLLGVDDCLFGTLPGFILGLALSFVVRRYTPTFRPPQVGEPSARRRPDAETDITGPPQPGVFRKPDAFEEEP
jgi:hypothetical protein